VTVTELQVAETSVVSWKLGNRCPLFCYSQTAAPGLKLFVSSVLCRTEVHSSKSWSKGNSVSHSNGQTAVFTEHVNNLHQREASLIPFISAGLKLCLLLTCSVIVLSRSDLQLLTDFWPVITHEVASAVAIVSCSQKNCSFYPKLGYAVMRRRISSVIPFALSWNQISSLTGMWWHKSILKETVSSSLSLLWYSLSWA
jgi:hypothetical protein